MIDARRLWKTIQERPQRASTEPAQLPPIAHACSARELGWLQAGGATLVFKERMRLPHAPAASGFVRPGAPSSLLVRHATRYRLVPVDEGALVFDLYVAEQPIAWQILSA
jgi:hypothetical protein